MSRSPVLTFTDRGIYCPSGDFHIDPWRPVDRALITHGHSDHARWGHRRYLSTEAAAPVIRHRLGEIAAPAWKPGPPLHWRPLRRIEGIDVVMPGNWHKQLAELEHLEGLGLIDDDEWDRAIERLDSSNATDHQRYHAIYDQQEDAARSVGVQLDS